MNILKGNPPFNLQHLVLCVCNSTDARENVIIDSEIRGLLSQCLQSAAFLCSNESMTLPGSLLFALLAHQSGLYCTPGLVWGSGGKRSRVQCFEPDACSSCSKQTGPTLVSLVHLSKWSESNKHDLNIT